MRKERAILIENEEERKIYYPRFYGVIEDFPCMTEEEMQKCKRVVEKYTPKQ